MNLPDYFRTLVVLTALIVLGCTRSSAVDNYNINLTGKCIYVSDALNRLHAALPGNMTLDDKCRRYAIASSILGTTGGAREQVVADILQLEENTLLQHYRNINPVDLGPLFMNAIDGYRLSQLGPALVDVVECLRRLDTPPARNFLKKKEFNIIMQLYNQVLHSPDTKIDLSGFNFDKMHPSFKVSLVNLFGRYLPDDTPAIDLDHICPGARCGSSASRPNQHELRRFRQREQERLRQQLLRIVKPDESRAKARVRQQNRRQRIRQEEREMRLLRCAAIGKRTEYLLQQLQRPALHISLPAAASPQIIPQRSPYGSMLGQSSSPAEISRQAESSRWMINLANLRVEPQDAPQQVSPRSPQPLIPPMTPFPRLLQPTMEFPPESAPSFPSSLFHGNVTDDLVHHHDAQVYNYLTSSQATYEPMGQPDSPKMYTSRTLEPIGQLRLAAEIESDDDLKNFTNQLNDTEIMVQSFLEKSPPK